MNFPSSVFQAKSLLKGSMQIDRNSQLTIGGCVASELSQLSSYPIYVIDEILLRNNMRTYVKSLQKYYPKESAVYYASKALMNCTICKIAEQEGMGLDISSGGELYTAIRSQFPLDKVIFHGNNKSEDELKLALRNGIGRIAIDNFDEIVLLDQLTQELEVSVAVLIRVKPGIHADTHHYIVTGTESSKFGFNLHDGSAAEAIRLIKNTKKLEFKGIHCHIGSQIINLEGFEKTIEVLAEFFQILEKDEIEIEELDFGGGLGVQYLADDPSVAIEDYIQMIATKMIDVFKEKGLALPKLMLEPGRSIVAEAGITLYKIGSIKKMTDGTLYAAVNGGMTDNIRPALYGAKYCAVIANRADATADHQVKIVGKCCESGDIVIEEIFLPKPVTGDTLAVFTTGAYNYSMASNYNRLPVPGILLVNEGSYDWIVIPQNYEDILRNDRIPGRFLC